MSQPLVDKIKLELGLSTLERSHDASCYVADAGQKLFVKSSVGHHRKAMMIGELESLTQIRATRCIRVPEPKLVLHDYDQSEASTIVLEYLDISPLNDISASDLGHNLAQLHDYNNKTLRFHRKAKRWVGGLPPSLKLAVEIEQSDHSGADRDENTFTKHNIKLTGGQQHYQLRPQTDSEYADKFIPHTDEHTGQLFEGVNQFGFHVPTACGQIAQVNDWMDSWESFFAQFRLDKPIRTLLSDYSDRELSQLWSHLQLKLSRFFKDLKSHDGLNIVPALLHGDLWSGNAAELTNDPGHSVAYDPSSFYGHSEYDLAIVRMFGNFPKTFESSYFEILPKGKMFEQRNKLYQLFHHLNHWMHFGSGYRASSLRIIKDLNALV